MIFSTYKTTLTLIKAGARATLFGDTFKWGEEIKICNGGKPCFPKPIDNMFLVHDFGDVQIFSIDINFVCVLVPCMFTIGASANLALHAGVSGVLGVPEALDFEKKLWGEENLKVSPSICT